MPTCARPIAKEQRMQVIERVTGWVVTGIFAFFVAITFLQVVLRYLFSNSLGWIDEISRYGFIWVVFLAAAMAARHGTHLAITLLEEVLGARSRRFLLVLADLGLIAFGGLIGVGGWRLIQLNWTSLSPATGIPIAWVQMILPVFAVLLILFSAEHLVSVIRRRTDLDRDDPEGSGL